MHRSVYHLKEADPHTWAIPRLGRQRQGGAGGDPGRRVRRRRRRTDALRAVRAPPCARSAWTTAYGAYLDLVPASTLATSNMMSLFGLHRRWRGALVGHLAAFEMTSSVPNRRYGNGPAPPGRRRRPPPGSTTSTSTPTPCTSRSPRTTCAAAWPQQEPRAGRTSCSARGARWRWTARSADAPADALAGRETSLRRPQCRGSPRRQGQRGVLGLELRPAAALAPDDRRAGRADRLPGRARRTVVDGHRGRRLAARGLRRARAPAGPTAVDPRAARPGPALRQRQGQRRADRVAAGPGHEPWSSPTTTCATTAPR